MHGLGTHVVHSQSRPGHLAVIHDPRHVRLHSVCMHHDAAPQRAGTCTRDMIARSRKPGSWTMNQGGPIGGRASRVMGNIARESPRNISVAYG